MPWVACGAARLPVPRADAFEPPASFSSLHDVRAAVDDALSRPLEAPRLRELARGAASVVVTIPDASRPCPSEPVLEALLEELTAAGVPEDAVTVAIGCGLHAMTTPAERERLAGRDLARRLDVIDAQGIECEISDLGATSLGAPVHIVRRVADADLAITVGVVEPHLYAGFSGGVKGVSIGCAGRETIAWTHRPAFISASGVTLGRLRGNPFQTALLEIAARTPLRWGVNLVMASESGVCAVAAGEPAAVQRTLAGTHSGAWLRTVGGAFDVVVAGVRRPKSDNLYQASRAATYIGLAGRPALEDGGLILLCADLPDGAGAGPGERNFLAVLRAAGSPSELLERGRREPLGPGGQRAYVVARILERFRLAVVGAADPTLLAGLEHLGVAAFDSVDAALTAEDARLGRRARVLAVADAITTIVGAA